MRQPLRLLVAEGLRDREALLGALQAAGYDVTWSTQGDEGEWDAVLMDGPTFRDSDDGIESPVIVVTDDPEVTERVIRDGAYHCHPETLLPTVVDRALTESSERHRRQELEDELAKAEERYHDLVEAANDVVLAIDLQGNFLALNAAGEQISGYTRDEVRRMNMAQVLTPESLRLATEMIQQKLVTNQPTTYRLEMIARDGHLIPLEVSTRLICHDGRPVGVHAIARDITERLRAEAELRARERKQAAVADLGQKALAIADLGTLFDDAVQTVSQTLDVQFCTILQLDPERNRLSARAGCGWSQGVVEHEVVGSGPESQAGYTLYASEPVIVEDLSAETRFAIPPVLLRHNIRSGISVIIHGSKYPFGVLSAFTDVQRLFAQDDVHFLQVVANVLAAAIERKRLEDERAEHDKDLATRVLQAQEAERKRISRELHDETAQTLSILLTNLDLLEPHLPPDDATLHQGFQRVAGLAKRALDETRALSHDLRPTILDDAGLVAALEWIAAEYGRTYGGTVRVDAEIDDGSPLTPEQEVALFRIAQEALNNAGKHSRARQVKLRLRVCEESAELSIIDDGRGFDPDRIPGPTREGQLGLYGMAERAGLLGGDLSIRSAPKQGAEVLVTMPLKAGAT
jgi:PAS domain S-box-containing protein